MAYKSTALATRPASDVALVEEPDSVGASGPLDLSGLTSIVGYPLRRAQIAVFEDFARRFAALDLTPAQYSTLVAIGDNPGRESIRNRRSARHSSARTFVAMMDELRAVAASRERTRSELDRRSKRRGLDFGAGRSLARKRARRAGQLRSGRDRCAAGPRYARAALVTTLLQARDALSAFETNEPRPDAQGRGTRAGNAIRTDGKSCSAARRWRWTPFLGEGAGGEGAQDRHHERHVGRLRRFSGPRVR